MNPQSNRRWGHPASILFATELPVNERVFSFALAQARNSNSRLIFFHAYDTLVVSASETSGVRYYDYAAAARTEIDHLEPMAERARAAGVDCEIVVHQGLAPQLILECAREKKVDRIVVGTRSPGPIGKILVGSVAEEVLRHAEIPVCTIGPEAVDQAYQGYVAKTILLATSLNDSAIAAAALAAEVAANDGARLVMLHVMQRNGGAPVRRTIEQLEADLRALVPVSLRGKIVTEELVVPGDPVDEILFHAKSKRADLLVLGAQKASLLSTLTRRGVVYKVLGHAPCPVFTLSPRGLRASAEVEESNLELHLTGSV